MFRRAIAIAASTVLISIALASQIKFPKKVRVFDSHFKCIKTLSSTEDLFKFEKIWNKKQIVSLPSKPAWNYKLDLTGFENGGRWLYCSSGQTELLTKKVSLPYQIQDYRQLNELLGISNQAPASAVSNP